MMTCSGMWLRVRGNVDAPVPEMLPYLFRPLPKVRLQLAFRGEESGPPASDYDFGRWTVPSPVEFLYPVEHHDRGYHGSTEPGTTYRRGTRQPDAGVEH